MRLLLCCPAIADRLRRRAASTTRVSAVCRALLLLLRFEKMDEDAENLASTLDLREEPSECKRPATRKVLSGIFKAPVWVRARLSPLCVMLRQRCIH